MVVTNVVVFLVLGVVHMFNLARFLLFLEVEATHSCTSHTQLRT
jgi:hypothetical protein